MSFLLVHGLGLSSSIWSLFAPLLDGEVISVDLPGHGSSISTDYSWFGILRSISNANMERDWSQTILVLHSFSASLLPELVKEGVRPCKVIIIEGILSQHDALWSDVVSSLDDAHFDNWLLRFRSVAEMALKSQLVTRQNKADIQIWSSSFRVVNGDSLRLMARNLKERLISNEIEVTLGIVEFPLMYIRGENSRLSEIGRIFLHEHGVSIIDISDSGHFPMIDNPKALAILIGNCSRREIGINHGYISN
jgi:pimeloyl-ACP methyl ester carboxylesterase